MKVAFINPKGFLPADAWMPLGALQLATVLAADHDVILVDEEHFEVDPESIQDCDVLCVTGMSHQAAGIDQWIARGNRWNKRVIVGGVHASLNPEMIKNAIVSLVRAKRSFPTF